MKRFFLTFLCIFMLFSTNVSAQEENIDIYSEYAIVVHLNNDHILYEKNSEEKMFPASMTKIMTVLVALENIEDLTKTYTFEEKTLEGLVEANASVVGYEVGEVATYEDLLYGIMLSSGADACRAIAISLFGNEDNFVEKMNDKAKALGMHSTHFVNTTGLHDDNHYTSVKDFSVLLKHALQNKMFKKIFTTFKYVTEDGAYTLRSTYANAKDQVYSNTDMIKGAKTGFTYPASQCLASYAKDGKEEYIIISGNTKKDSGYPYHILDASTLYSYFIDNYERIVCVKKGEVLKEVEIIYGKEEQYLVEAKKNLSFLGSNKKDFTIEFEGKEEVEAPFMAASYIGTLYIKDKNGKIIYEEPYFSEYNIERNNFTYYIAHPFLFIKDYAFFFLGIIAFMIAKKIMNNPKIKKKFKR